MWRGLTLQWHFRCSVAVVKRHIVPLTQGYTLLLFYLKNPWHSAPDNTQDGCPPPVSPRTEGRKDVSCTSRCDVAQRSDWYF